MDKQALRQALLTSLQIERDTLVAAQRATSEGVTHDDSRAESDKDTRAIEASYLARGQAERAEALEADVHKVQAMRLRSFGGDEPITLSAVVRLRADDDTERTVFLAPAGGGVSLPGGVKVVTPQSPVGRALTGARLGDVVLVERAAGAQELEIVSVA